MTRPAPERALPRSSYALSPLQEGMLFHSLREPHTGVDIEQVVFNLEGPLDRERLRWAWQRASDRYEILRTSFRWGGERPLQNVWPEVVVPFALEERRSLAPGDRERYVAACVREERRTGMSLAEAPLQRVRLIRFRDTAHTLIWTNHHAILDGRARTILLRDIVAAYGGSELAPPALQFSAHVDWLEACDVSASEPFWRDYLRGFTAPTPLPVAFAVAAVPAAEPTHTATRTLDAAATAPLHAFAQAHGLTTSVLLQAAWALVLARHAGTPDVVFGTVRSCRHSGVDGSAGIVGLLINTLPLRIAVDEEAPLVPWLRGVRARSQALRDVEHTPLRAVSSWSDVNAATPLFGSLVVYDRETLAHSVRTSIDPDGLLGVRRVRSFHQTGAPLTLAAAGSTELELQLTGDARRFGRADVDRLLGHVVAILRALPAAAGGNVRAVSMLGEDERRHVLEDFNRTSVYPRDASVPELFAAQAARTPHAIAVQLGAATLTYGELAQQAAAVAAHLHGLGIGRGDYVGLCVERSFAMIAALLGTLQAGAASIALDPTHPAERIAFILREGGVRTILTQTQLLGTLAEVQARSGARAMRIVNLATLPARSERAVRLPVVEAEDPAVVMYTSGSTGAPKGAVLPHRAIVRTVRGADYLRFEADETFFGFVPLTFDVAILELWGPLLSGARLVLCPPGLPSLDVLANTIEAAGVTTLWLTTGLFDQMLDEQLPRLRGLRRLIVGGDVMSPAHARRAMAALPDTQVINVYGPTEATVLITAQPLVTPPDGPIPLGAPIANARVYVLDASRRPIPVGVPGEIYTGGDGVALGYLNRPDLTAERFVLDPFAGRVGATMYRTGDLARWRPDGTVDFLGRVDNKLKIRGVRVELGEIEAVLAEHPAVREAVVVCAAPAAGEKQLIAYVVARTGMPLPDPGEIQAFLRARLPNQMLPAGVAFLDRIPLTATGKFDRRALPDPASFLLPSATRERRAPASTAEIAVAGHVAEILGIDEIGLDDDFYEFGGDSLRAMRLVSRLRTAFGVDLSIRDLLAAPRVGDLTAAITALERDAPGNAPSEVTAVYAGGTQAPLFFLHGDLAGGGYYCREIAQRLGDERPLYVIAPHGAPAGRLPRSVKAMARENAAAIRALVSKGPVLLGGFCNGAIVAYEIACQLERAGVAVEGVVLIDAFNVNAGPLAPSVRVRHGLRQALESFRLPGSRPVSAAKWDEWHERWLERWFRVLARYVPGTYGGRVSLLWTDDAAARSERLTAEWRRFAPAAIAGRVPGTHLTSITRHLAETSRIVAEHVRGTGGAIHTGT